MPLRSEGFDNQDTQISNYNSFRSTNSERKQIFDFADFPSHRKVRRNKKWSSSTREEHSGMLILQKGSIKDKTDDRWHQPKILWKQRHSIRSKAQKKKGSALPVFDNGKAPHKFSQEERKSTPLFFFF
jgi:hypothetical protein